MDGAEYTDAPTPKEGDTVCIGCGGVLDPLQTLLTTTGRCLPCDRAYAAALAKRKMVPT